MVRFTVCCGSWLELLEFLSLFFPQVAVHRLYRRSMTSTKVTKVTPDQRFNTAPRDPVKALGDVNGMSLYSMTSENSKDTIT